VGLGHEEVAAEVLRADGAAVYHGDGPDTGQDQVFEYFSPQAAAVDQADVCRFQGRLAILTPDSAKRV
jgi:hypothetical protein